MNALWLVCANPDCEKVLAIVHHARTWAELEPTPTGAADVQTYTSAESGVRTYTITCHCGRNYPKRHDWIVAVWQLVTRASGSKSVKWPLDVDPVKGAYRNY